MSSLNVFLNDTRVGTIESPDGSGITFRYCDSWIEASGFPISQSLPLHTPDFSNNRDHNFFENLLPEANVRNRICKKLGISAGNSYELLKAIGGDCAGALTITPNDTPPEPDNEYELISEKQLANWSIGAPDAFSEIAGQQDIRLSLAGAQDKLPVRAIDDHFYLPKGNSPSTHILKFASPDYSHLPENETFITMLANSVGLNAVEIGLYQTQKARIAVVVRYDRTPVENGFLRVHQEDFCQALGIGPENKYQKEGGPGIHECARLIKQACTIPAIELERLIRWVIFNLLVHNADAHGKNVSLIYSNGKTTLAPFYDLVCTRNYPSLARKLAMSLGGEDDPDLIQSRHLLQLADVLGVGKSLVRDITTETADRLRSELPETVKNFNDRFGDSPVLQRISEITGKRIRKALQLLEH